MKFYIRYLVPDYFVKQIYWNFWHHVLNQVAQLFVSSDTSFNDFFVVIQCPCVEFHCLCTKLLVFAFELLSWDCPNFNFQFYNSFAVRDSGMNKRWKICWLCFLPLRILRFWKLSKERLAVFVCLYLCSWNNSRGQKWQHKAEGNGQYWGQLGVHKIDYEFLGKDHSSVCISACCAEAGAMCCIKVRVKQLLL